MKNRLAIAILLLTFTIPALAADSAAAKKELDCPSSSTVVFFKNGTQMAIRCYSVRGGSVVMKTREGKLVSVPRTIVDWEATEPGNDHTDSPAKPAASAANGLIEGAPEDSPEAFHAADRAVETSRSRENTINGARPIESFLVGDDGGNGESAAFAPTGTLTFEPPPPEPPEVINRDGRGKVTLRAVRLSEPLEVDGKLEESVYRTTPSISDFVQQEPKEGDPATEQTEVWVFFDGDNVYISARCWDSHPERMVANEMRRDNHNLHNNQNFAVILDTFYDKRNGFLFYTNPLGGLYDAQVTDESNTNSDWNTVWQVKTGRFEQGWTVEMEFPFKSLRYKPGASQIWGINFRRMVQWKNETSYLTPIAAAFRRGGLAKLSQAATMVGLEPPTRSVNLEVKPFATGGVRTDLTADEPYSNDFDGNVGFDVKYGVTRGLTSDFTYNTDFAQVEIDEQQVNLTRFSLFFPEKRDFFLEGQGIFNFGGRSTQRFGGEQSDMPIMFYSRRIGLQDDYSVPINAGGRLTGRAGKYTVGALAMQTEELGVPTDVVESGLIPTTNFGVARVKRDIFGRSNIGFIGTYRSQALDGGGSNGMFGVDGNFTFYQNLDINTYYARSSTPGLNGNDASYMGKLEYGGDLIGVELTYLAVDPNFRPEVGFLRREDMQKSFGQIRYSPRPRAIKAIRQFNFEGSFDNITNSEGEVLETRIGRFEFRTQFENGDSVQFEFSRNYEFLDEDFEITDGLFLPIGGYDFNEFNYRYRFGPQRRVSGMANFSHGSFYSGSRKSFSIWSRAEMTRQFTLEPRISQNWVDLQEGSFTTTLFSLRADYMFSPRAFVGALIQYNSDGNNIFSNIRFRWEYRPGSDIYVVYSDGRSTAFTGFPSLENRSLVFKVTRLFRF